MVLESLSTLDKVVLVLIILLLLKIMFDINRLMKRKNMIARQKQMSQQVNQTSAEHRLHQMEKATAVDADFVEEVTVVETVEVPADSEQKN
ncbi:hypothetical protein MsAg5_00270 [Methanosarcinaceae archaeon Ag5]|uniref:Uncharacterized protein n=1 Tax=Methanolapillus africanus TaxID=3028297 RepID=A0AAE4SED8_9EURY|nr:hypothetical protein [Methanosarcinaceae archaeon Ag5]